MGSRLPLTAFFSVLRVVIRSIMAVSLVSLFKTRKQINSFPRQLPVFHPMRLIGGLSKPLFPVCFVF